jgi:hypothetical protein
MRHRPGKYGKQQQRNQISNPKIWYVSCETYVTRRRARHSQSFENEEDAKQFAKVAAASGKAVYAGTISPHTPKQFIPPHKLDEWLNTGELAPVREHADIATSAT